MPSGLRKSEKYLLNSFHEKLKKKRFFKKTVNSKESIFSKDKQIKQYKLITIGKILKTLKNHWEKMSVRVNIGMPKIMRTSIKVSVRMYVEPWVFLHREKYIQELEMDLNLFCNSFDLQHLQGD